MTALAFSPTERIIHAAGFELILILIATPLMSWAMDKPLETVGALTLALCAIAMLWNMLYNAIIDTHIKTERIHWSLTARIAHALAFEGGLVLVCVPLAAWMLDITLIQALMLEMAFIVLLLPYTVGYNWVFDQAKHYLSNRVPTPDHSTSR